MENHSSTKNVFEIRIYVMYNFKEFFNEPSDSWFDQKSVFWAFFELLILPDIVLPMCTLSTLFFANINIREHLSSRTLNFAYFAVGAIILLSEH